MLKIPRTLFEMNESLVRAKQIMRRMELGQQYIDKATKAGSVNDVFNGAKLFNRLANELNNELEDALFLHETLATGKTTVIDRNGRPVNTTQFNPKEEKVVDLYTLRSMKLLKEVFGEDAIIEFEPESE